MSADIYGALHSAASYLNVFSASSQIIGSGSVAAESPGSEVNKHVAPFTALLQMCLIIIPKSKVMFQDNRLIIQPPGPQQSYGRTTVRGALKIPFGQLPPSHNDYCVFKSFIERSITWYTPSQNPAVAKIFKFAIKGLETLRDTYIGTENDEVVKLMLNPCITLLSDKNKWKELEAGKKSTPASAEKSEDRKFWNNIKNIWSPEKINQIAHHIEKWQLYKKSRLAEELSRAECHLAIIESMISLAVLDHQKIIKQTFSCSK